MPCQHCRETHGSYPSVHRAFEILAIRDYRKACRSAARRWLEILFDTVIEALPKVNETAVMFAAASWLETSHPEHSQALREIANKAMTAWRRGSGTGNIDPAR